MIVEVLTTCHNNTVKIGRSPAEIVGSNPTGGIDICLL